jgi:amino acid permease
LKQFIGLVYWFRESYVNLVVCPLFLLTLYIQVANQLHWDYAWLIALSPLLCLLSWIAGVLMTWQFVERAWMRWLEHDRRWKTARNCACITGGCALLVALVALSAQVETEFAPKAYIILSWCVMVANTYVLLVYNDLTKKRQQAPAIVQTAPVEQSEEKQV